MNFLRHIKEVPAWAVLVLLFLWLSGLYHIRPDAVTEDGMKGILAALLLSLRPTQPPTPPTPNP